MPSIFVIGDFVDRDPPPAGRGGGFADDPPWRPAAGGVPAVAGGYLERLPLACIAAGLVEQAEIWHHRAGGGYIPPRSAGDRLTYRSFALDAVEPPFDNREMIAFIERFGAPHILVVYGLGVSAAVLHACRNSVILYNSIDAPALRVPPEVSALCDIVLTGAQWQSDAVAARHPGKTTAILPVGPDFAAIDQFRPLATAKDYDLIYVAAAQPYKRHDILFDALERLPRDVRALCVFGYGEDAERLRQEIAGRGISVDCIGPPGVPFDEVNRLMNRARFGVVCGRDDGAPAILTEYMLAGLPVLANAELACGLQYILPETGMIAHPADFADAIMAMRAHADRFRPREAVLARWTWPHGVARVRALIDHERRRKSRSL